MTIQDNQHQNALADARFYLQRAMDCLAVYDNQVLESLTAAPQVLELVYETPTPVATRKTVTRDEVKHSQLAWKPEADQVLLYLKKEGKTNQECAVILERTIYAIKGRCRELRNLGLMPRSQA